MTRSEQIREAFHMLQEQENPRAYVRSYYTFAGKAAAAISQAAQIDLKPKQIHDYLVESGFLEETDGALRPTEEGRDAGFLVLRRSNHEGFYMSLNLRYEGVAFVLARIRELLCRLDGDFRLLLRQESEFDAVIDLLQKVQVSFVDTPYGTQSKIDMDLRPFRRLMQWIGMDENGYESQKTWPEDLTIEEMNLDQIRSKLFLLARAQRFGDFVFEGNLMNGTYLAIVRRLKKLKEELDA